MRKDKRVFVKRGDTTIDITGYTIKEASAIVDKHIDKAKIENKTIGFRKDTGGYTPQSAPQNPEPPAGESAVVTPRVNE